VSRFRNHSLRAPIKSLNERISRLSASPSATLWVPRTIEVAAYGWQMHERF
jgi:hypothetical protein